ncbi:hypothetical protein [Sphingomonas rubra]|uniref:Thioredoxin reductase (NADPH) n=1 Tax=Sphingomonas rubra TaxID=634430 RepID=A0A1I5RA54_9SPHN|nr:hypothetical protein [Sphingomonas rubra]SFP55373.1 thioredoxin reductase (NADPH) [Sphingomonas rubra]
MHGEVLILGSGPAAHMTAVCTTRAVLEPPLVTDMQPGGQLTIATDVENWPGTSASPAPR